MCNPGKTGSRRKQEVLLDATTRNVTSSADPVTQRCNKNQDESKQKQWQKAAKTRLKFLIDRARQ